MDRRSEPSILRKGLTGSLRISQIDSQTILLLGVFLVLAIFFSVTEERFLTVRSVTSMGFQLPELGVLSLAMMITILVGGINLSVNATSNLAAVLAGFFMVKFIPPDATPEQIVLYLAVAIIIALFVGLVSGVINGFLVGYMALDSILATLATMTLYTGISTGLTGGATVTGFPEQVSVIGNEKLLGIPIPFIIFVFLTVLTYFLLYRTPFGFKARMLGSNPIASKFSGIDNQSIIMKIYVISGIFSAITGILIMSRTMSAAYEYGTTTYVLLTILIAVLAGIIPGFGNVLNIFIAVIILQILSTGFHMVLAGIRGSSFFKDFSWGVLLILIFIINYFMRRRRTQE
ncbi:MAG: ABC transporter permease [Anaerolineae bacterium]